MKTIIDGTLHKIVYIDYIKGLPFSVMTKFFVPKAVGGAYWRLVNWVFFCNDGDKNDLRAYKYGSGGTIISAPMWADGFIGNYWIAEGTKLSGTVKNGVQLLKPKRVKQYNSSSINPFKIAEIVGHYEYCERCGHYSTETCWAHKYEDEEDECTLKYKDDNSYAE